MEDICWDHQSLSRSGVALLWAGLKAEFGKQALGYVDTVECRVTTLYTVVLIVVPSFKAEHTRNSFRISRVLVVVPADVDHLVLD